MFCQICSELGGSSADFSNRLSIDLLNHSKLHGLQIDGSYVKDNEQRYFDRCFPYIKNGGYEEENTDDNDEDEDLGNQSVKISVKSTMDPKPNASWINVQVSIRDHVCSTIKSYSGNLAQCQICNKSIKFMHGKSYYVTNILDHVCSHVNKKLFICRHCEYTSCTRASMQHHIYQRHKVAFDKTNYIDNSEKNRGEILAKFDQCFKANQKLKRKSTPKPALKRLPKTVNKLAAPAKKSFIKPLKTAIRGKNLVKTTPAIHCSNLIKQFRNDSQQMWCRLCSKAISIKNSFSFNPANIMDHALGVHLKKDVYACKLCSTTTHNRNYICKHIMNAHKSSSIGNYVDNTKKYEAAIMKILTECYDRSQKNIALASDEELPTIEKKSQGKMVAFYDCNICPFSTKYEKLMQKHIILRHPD